MLICLKIYPELNTWCKSNVKDNYIVDEIYYDLDVGFRKEAHWLDPTLLPLLLPQWYDNWTRSTEVVAFITAKILFHLWAVYFVMVIQIGFILNISTAKALKHTQQSSEEDQTSNVPMTRQQYILNKT